MQFLSIFNKLSLQLQLRWMTGISLLGMLAVIIIVLLNLSNLRQEFQRYANMQRTEMSLIKITSAALEVRHSDPLLEETSARLEQADSAIRTSLQEVSYLAQDQLAQSGLNNIRKQWTAYVLGMQNAVRISSTAPNDALLVPDAMYNMHLAPMVLTLDKLLAANNANKFMAKQNIDAAMQNILWVTLLPMIGLGLMTAISQTMFGHSLRKRLEGIVDEISHLHNGDLSRRLATHNDDEIGCLSVTINNFITRFQGILHDVHSSADQTHRTASGVSQMAHSVTNNAKEQSSKVSQVSLAIEGMGNTIKRIAANAGDASAAANNTLSLVKSGSEASQSAIRALSQMDRAVSSSVHTLGGLNVAIQRIDVVSKLIKTIAEQTNLLALNAAIEAARAGDHGRGFAVVANEVRKLAERTSVATSDITLIINNINIETVEATRAMTLAKEKAALGVTHGEGMGQLFAQVEHSILVVTEMMRQIASSTEVQSAAGEDIWRNIDSVATISAQTASDIEHARNEMTILANASRILFEAMGQFKLVRTA